MWQSNELYHYGKVGMKWGKKTAKRSVSTTKPKAKRHPDKVVIEQLKKKSMSELSNEELKAVNNRTSLEASYIKGKETTKKGSSLIRKTAKTAVMTVAAAYATKGLTNLVEGALHSEVVNKGVSKGVSKVMTTAVLDKAFKK